MSSNILVRFKEDQRGVATVESVLWMPIFFYLFILITDASFIFYSKAEALRIIQDGNRAYSVHAFDTDTATSDYIKAQLSKLSPQATVSTRVSNGIIITTATMKTDDLMAVGSIPAFINSEISVTSQHYMEY